ncbi:MAG: metallopeptidase TldD-related protein [Vicinamibacterales bacterium]
MLALSRADACVVIGRRDSTANLRWANNTATTNGVAEEVSLSIVSIMGRRVASVTRTHFPADDLEAMVRESEAACEGKPEAPDFMPLPVSTTSVVDWAEPAGSTDIRIFDGFAHRLAGVFGRARAANLQTFGYGEHQASTTWLASSTGLRRRHASRIGKVEVTAKTPDFSRSSWGGTVTEAFADVDPDALFDRLQRRLDWSSRIIALPAGHYQVLLEPSATADLAVATYELMARRDADEGRSPFSSPGGGARLGERLFGGLTMYSDPTEPGIGAIPFHSSVDSGSMSSVFDNGLDATRTEWIEDGYLRALVTPRYWAARAHAGAIPYVDNLIVAGEGPSLEQMVASTKRGLLVTCFWYIRTVDPQTALMTGLTRDGVFLVENGEIAGAVNNFRWNMSPIGAFAQTSEIGRTGMALPREHDEFLRAKAPATRIDDFNMSSVSEAT